MANTRVQEILLRARDTLSDPSGDRYTDARLLRLVDAAQKAICLHLGLLRDKTDLGITTGIPEIALPTDIEDLTRILDEYGEPLPVYTHAEMDSIYGPTWETDVGSPVEALVYDKLNPDYTKVYPIPDTVENSSFDLLSALSAYYGVTVTLGVPQSTDKMSSDFGVVVGVSQHTFTNITIYYKRSPATISADTDIPEIGEVCDAAIKFYVTGMALQDDNDAQSMSKSAQELSFYESQLNALAEISRKNLTVLAGQKPEAYNRSI